MHCPTLLSTILFSFPAFGRPPLQHGLAYSGVSLDSFHKRQIPATCPPNTCPVGQTTVLDLTLSSFLNLLGGTTTANICAALNTCTPLNGAGLLGTVTNIVQFVDQCVLFSDASCTQPALTIGANAAADLLGLNSLLGPLGLGIQALRCSGTTTSPCTSIAAAGTATTTTPEAGLGLTINLGEPAAATPTPVSANAPQYGYAGFPGAGLGQPPAQGQGDAPTFPQTPAPGQEEVPASHEAPPSSDPAPALLQTPAQGSGESRASGDNAGAPNTPPAYLQPPAQPMPQAHPASGPPQDAPAFPKFPNFPGMWGKK